MKCSTKVDMVQFKHQISVVADDSWWRSKGNSNNPCFFDLSWAAAMEQKGFHTVEQEIGKVLRDLALRAMEESLLSESKATMDKHMIT